MRLILFLTLVASLAGLSSQSVPATKGRRLADLTWSQAEPLLTAQTVVVIPMASSSTEHGHHLPLRTDLALADYFADRIVQSAPVVVAPTVSYQYAPGLLEYPGSATLALPTSRDVIVDLVRSLARYGPRRFYVLSTSPAGDRALEPAAASLASEGVLLRFPRYETLLDRVSRGIRQQSVVGHADEVETSMLLFASPGLVDMSKAARDFASAAAFGRLTRRRDVQALYSPTGAWGDPTLATKDKGRTFADAVVASMIQEIEELRQASIPSTSPPAATPEAGSRSAGPTVQNATPGQQDCTAGDERTIRAIGDSFAVAWAAADAERLGGLWSGEGNIVHPDGMVERGSLNIKLARAELLARPEYRGTRHPMLLTMVRCLSANVAVADGRWELRGLRSSAGVPLPTLEGLCTLVVRRYGGNWLIEAYRYSMKTPGAQTPTNVTKRPGGN
jgi:creatinine amidohydrolase